MSPLTLVLLATLQVQYQPAQPRVGDPVTITYRVGSGQRVEVAAGENYEVVSSSPNGAVVRSFRPGAFVVQGAIAGPDGRSTFRGPEVRVGSVLGPKDDLKPAPLVPPRPVPRPAYARKLIWGAAAFAALAWLALFALSRLRPRHEAVGHFEERFDFEMFVRSLHGRPLTQVDIAELADATRRHLGLGLELTTTELLASLRADEHRLRVAREILSQGDLAKFAPWGSPAAGTDRLARAAESLITPAKEVADAAVQ